MDEREGLQACPACAAIAASSATFCSGCGARLSATAEPAVGRGKWYHNIWFVLAMLFLVAGPFGLPPLVWKNLRLPRWAKALLTAAVVLYTLLLINTTIVMVQAVMKEIGQFTTTLPQ